MRMSVIFGQTLRQAPSDTESVGHALLLRAGFVRRLASGIFSYLPRARRTMDKIEAIITEVINTIGGQEVTMPVVHPARRLEGDGALVRSWSGARAVPGQVGP